MLLRILKPFGAIKMAKYLGLLIVTLLAGIGFIGAKLTHTDDGPLEEAAEEIIQDIGGFNVDLTPGSKEED